MTELKLQQQASDQDNKHLANEPLQQASDQDSKHLANEPLQQASDQDSKHLANEPLQQAIDQAGKQLANEQRKDGHWIYELEADCTIPAEYILMTHFIGKPQPDSEQRIAIYLRQHQDPEHGGWTLFPGGDIDISCSVKAYYALKLLGDDPMAEHMVHARNAILSKGGAECSNIFTRITLTFFRQLPWRAIPFIPVEAILLPRWGLFHISKVAYWSRSVMIPLFVLCTLKAKAVNPRNIGIEELFCTPPQRIKKYFSMTEKSLWGKFFLFMDQVMRRLEPLFPKFLRQHAIKRCEKWFIARMNEDDGIGGIFPAMVNTYEALLILGYSLDDPLCIQARSAIDKLLCERGEALYCQPCVSPVWDTCLAAQAMIEAGDRQQAVTGALDWLVTKQLDKEPGDWRELRPQLAGGGWAFQYSNYYYPDLDDTAMVGWAMCLHDKKKYAHSITRAAIWLAGMQSKDGGFASFEIDNQYTYLNEIPFADHGALLDPPTADVTARVIAFLALADKSRYTQPIMRAIAWLKKAQEQNGSWFGRWGTNYIYGTWSVLSALEVAGEDMQQDWIQRATYWLYKRQNEDGSWGESNRSYYPGQNELEYVGTVHHTAWALLGLLSAGYKDEKVLQAGVQYLLSSQEFSGLWSTTEFNAPGFPRVFYLKYHGYARYFPFWALARYQRYLQQDE